MWLWATQLTRYPPQLFPPQLLSKILTSAAFAAFTGKYYLTDRRKGQYAPDVRA